MPGIEYSDSENRTHVLVWGNIPFLGENLPTGQMLEAVPLVMASLCLPIRARKRAWQCFEPEWIDKLLGIEVWNRKYDGWAPGEVASTLQQSGKTIPFVGLDFHTARQTFPLGMVLDVGSEVSEESVIESLKSRRCRGEAFGFPISGRALRNSRSALKMAERARRMAAAFVRTGNPFAVRPNA